MTHTRFNCFAARKVSRVAATYFFYARTCANGHLPNTSAEAAAWLFRGKGGRRVILA
jgi:hypothetical protein